MQGSFGEEVMIRYVDFYEQESASFEAREAMITRYPSIRPMMQGGEEAHTLRGHLLLEGRLERWCNALEDRFGGGQLG